MWNIGQKYKSATQEKLNSSNEAWNIKNIPHFDAVINITETMQLIVIFRVINEQYFTIFQS